MFYDLPDYVKEGLRLARKRDLGRKNRLRLHVDGEVYPILRLWDHGFSLEVENAPHLRGFVDIYDGARPLYQCLVICSSIENGEMIFEFKRQTAVRSEAPLDYYKDENTPVGFLR
jgi:hypothetical protein